MTLGDILSAASRNGASIGPWLAAADPALNARLEHAAGLARTDIGGLLGIAVADFTETASEEEWAALTSRLRDADDPGRVCAVTMIQRLLNKVAPLNSHTEEEMVP